MKSNGKKISFGNLIESDKFLFLLSFIAAIIIWFAVSLYASPSKDGVVTVPISIDMTGGVIEQNDYQVFGDYTQNVDVKINGPMYLINSITADDFEAVAKTNTVEGAGNATLKVSVSLKKHADDIEIEAQTVDTINVYFDIAETKEFEIEVDDSKIADYIPDDYMINSLTPLSTTLSITGPKTEIDKIKRVVCIPDINEYIYKSQTIDCDVSFEGYESGDTVIVNDYVSYDTTCKVKVDVWKNAEIPARVVLINNSNNYKATVYPVNVSVLIDTEIAQTTEYIDIATIDCSDIDSGDSKTIYSDDIKLDSSVKLNDTSEVYTVVFS